MSVTPNVNRVFIRREGMRAAKKNWWVLLILSLIILASAMFISKGAAWAVDRIVGTPESPSVISGLTAPEGANDLVRWLVTLLMLPLYAGMLIGHSAALMGMIREPDSAPQQHFRAFFRWLKRCLKATALWLWMLLWVFLWSVAAMGILFVAMLLSEVIPPLNTFLAVAATLGALALMVIILLRYCMAGFALADAPDRSVIDCLGDSKVLMSGNLLTFVKLQAPCIGIVLLCWIASYWIRPLLTTFLPLSAGAVETIMTVLAVTVALVLSTLMEAFSASYFIHETDALLHRSTAAAQEEESSNEPVQDFPAQCRISPYSPRKEMPMSVNYTVENVYLRQDAMQLTRKRFWPLAGLLLLSIFLPVLLETGLIALGDQLMIPEVSAVVEQYTYLTSTSKLTSSEPLLTALIDLFTSPKFLLFNLFYICLLGLFNAALSLGYTAQLIRAGRGDKPKVLGIFGQMRHCLKAWGLQLWTGLKTFLWALPGLALIISGLVMAGLQQVDAGVLLFILGVVLAAALCIPASYRYSLAPCILADEPERSIFECVKRSKALMKGRKWQCFKLSVPILLKLLGVIYLCLIVGEILLTALGLADNAIAAEVLDYAVYIPTAYFFIQLNLVHALFYLKRITPNSAPAEADLAQAAPVSAWLQEHLTTDIEPEEQADAPDAPAESIADSPEDIFPETNEEKESYHDQTDC